ncbi:hypothetical protein V7654_08445 [Bacillus sp. JJ1609]|uniref:hypothetical protein n=1 Tax=Bacillus sp. JJ1609 TaxID=3122977 RepID=UPI002FFF885C
MFIKVYTYHIIPEREQDFLEIQAQAENVYSRYIEKQSLFLRSKEDCTKWLEVQIYKDEISYDESIKIIDQQKEIADLYTKFLKLIISKEELTEENYEQILIK